MTTELQAQPAVLQMTIEIKRAATGKVDTYTLTGTPVLEQDQSEPDNGSDPQHDLS